MDIRGPSGSVEFTTPEGDFITEFSLSVSVKKWFTSVNSIKLMFGSITRNQKIYNEEQILSGTAENFLNYSGIKLGSEKVKGLFTKSGPDNLILTDFLWHDISESDLKSGSVNVFSDDEENILPEGTCYEIDYVIGRVRLIYPKIEKSDEITVNTGEGEFITEFGVELDVRKEVVIHYEYYKAYVKDLDYSVNYEKGKIARLIGGNIKSGSKVYCDYEVTASVGSELIEEVIDMAHTEILDLIGEEYEGNADIRLKYAESNIAMQYLLDSATVQTIQKLHSVESSRQLSRLGDKYADRFRQKGFKFMRSFIKTPAVMTGAKIRKNYSW
ncbi:hypothetical protein ACFL4T_03495 [candidate division KSB1 bacterium]